MSSPRHEETRSVRVAKQNTERAESNTLSKEQIHMNATPNSTVSTTAPEGFTPEYDQGPREDGTYGHLPEVNFYRGPNLDSDVMYLESQWNPGQPELGIHFEDDAGTLYSRDDLRRLVWDLERFLARMDAEYPETLDPVAEGLGMGLRRAREAARISVYDAARKFGYTAVQLLMVEAGVVQASPDDLDRAASIYGGTR